jgi:hypothetical protein
MPTPMELAMEYIRNRGTGGQYLGGSTGARAHDTPQGRFVAKRGNSAGHLLNEFDMNQYLNALGVGVPQASLHQEGGRPTMLTEFEEGATAYQPERDRRQVTQDFVPHALIANWDMLGLDNDNALRRPDGSLSYVDVGGAGSYRAQGAPKGGAFGSTVGELDTLRDKNAYELGHITEQDIGQSFDRYGGETAMNDALRYLQDAQTQNIMQQRIQDVARRVA